MRININHPIFFNKHYYFDKQELRTDIKPVHNSVDIEQELFDLYRAGRFERMFGLSPEETEWVPAQDAIKECFGLSTGGAFNIGNYCSINGVSLLDPQGNINNCNNDQQSGINIFTISTFCLSCDSIGSENYKIVLRYSVHRTIHQSLVPLLEFYSEDKLKHSYSSFEGAKIDLSQIGQRAISFEIPAKDIFTQNSGCYLIKFGASDFAKVIFSRCGLPINGGIYSFSELRDFCNGLNGSPSAELLSFYNIIKRGELAMWLQDNEEEGKYKKRISNCIDEINRTCRFKINDINTILEIVSNRTIKFPMLEYVSITVSGIDSGNIIGKQRVNGNFYYFVPWNSTIIGKLNVVITPAQNCENLDIEFNIDIKAQSGILVDDILVNLRDIEHREERALDFKFAVHKNQKMGESNIYFQDKQGCSLETKVSIIVTGEKVLIPLSDDSSITMIGIYSLKTSPFYLAQTTLSQKQVRVLIKIAEEKGLDCNYLLSAYSKAVNHDGANDSLPCSFIANWGVGSEVNRILNSLVESYGFVEPKINELEIALCDGLSKYIPMISTNKSENLRPISHDEPIHSTRLGIFDLLGNILSISGSAGGIFGLGTYFAFGTTYSDPENSNHQKKITEVNECYIGYRPKMVKISSAPTTPKRDYETNDVVDADTWLADRWTTEIDF